MEKAGQGTRRQGEAAGPAGAARRSIAPGFVEDALACLRAAAIDGAPLLRRAGITPGQAASAESYGRFWRDIAFAMEDEFFGLGARPMRPGSFVLMAEAAQHAGTLGRALERILGFLRIVLDDPCARLRQNGGRAEIVLRDRRGVAPAFATRTYWLLVMGLACWLAGRRLPLLQVDFACQAPPNRADYHQFFGAPVRFGQADSLLAFDAAYLALPVARSDRALAAFLRAAPGNILVRYRQDPGTASRLLARLRATPPAEWPGFAECAAELRMSAATLRRRLRAEGQGFAALRSAAAQHHAERLLRAGTLTVAQVAAEMGYSEPGAFHRAFRGWTGQSPGAFRAASRQPPASCGKT